MNDTSPAESTPPGPVPADDPGRALTHVSPDTDDSLPHLGVVGDTYTILVSGADTAGRYTLIDMHVPPGGGPPPHRHDFEEMFTVLDGEIEFTFRGVSAVATAGETINVPANAPHVFKNVSEQPGATALSLLARRARRSSSRRSACRSRTEPRPRRRSTMPPGARSSPRRPRSPRSTGPNCCSAGRSPESNKNSTGGNRRSRVPKVPGTRSKHDIRARHPPCYPTGRAPCLRGARRCFRNLPRIRWST